MTTTKRNKLTGRDLAEFEMLSAGCRLRAAQNVLADKMAAGTISGEEIVERAARVGILAKRFHAAQAAFDRGDW